MLYGALYRYQILMDCAIVLFYTSMCSAIMVVVFFLRAFMTRLRLVGLQNSWFFALWTLETTCHFYKK